MNSDLIDAQNTSNETTQLAALPNLMSIKWLVFLAVFYTLYFAQSLIIPLVLTLLVALLLSPLVACLKAVHIPRAISAIVLMGMLITPFTFLGMELAQPAQKWAKLIPKLSVQLTEQLESISQAFEQQEREEKKVIEEEKREEQGFSFFAWFDSEKVEQVVKQEKTNVVTDRIKQGGIEVLLQVMGSAPILLAQFATSLILILFLLIYGPQLFAAFVQELPNVEAKQRAERLVNQTQQQLSRYIITLSVINLGLGLCTAVVLHFIGLDDALLWGVVVGILNFIPYVGSVIGVLVIGLAGLVQFSVDVAVLVPVGAYMALNLVESQFITPTVLGKNMLINPLVVILWLFICGWLWGIAGILLSVPLLVCIKIVLAELSVWKNWLTIIETGGKAK
jgi:predicted PurR-regulated permease PerM